MNLDNPFVDEVLDRLQLTGTATSRKMFGGYGIFQDELMFALIADNELYLKVDGQSKDFFTALNLPPFSYSKSNGKTYQMSYYLAPESFFEDADETIAWANRALQASRRTSSKSR